ELASSGKLLRTAASKRRELDGARATFAERLLDPSIDSETALALLREGRDSYASWLTRLGFGYRGWKKRVKETIRPTNLDYGAVVALCELAELAHGRLAWFAEHAEPLNSLPGLGTTVSGIDAIPEVSVFDDAAAAFERAAILSTERRRLRLGPA